MTDEQKQTLHTAYQRVAAHNQQGVEQTVRQELIQKISSHPVQDMAVWIVATNEILHQMLRLVRNIQDVEVVDINTPDA